MRARMGRMVWMLFGLLMLFVMSYAYEARKHEGRSETAISKPPIGGIVLVPEAPSRWEMPSSAHSRDPLRKEEKNVASLCHPRRPSAAVSSGG